MSTARFRCDACSVISDFANGSALIEAHTTDGITGWDNRCPSLRRL